MADLLSMPWVVQGLKANAEKHAVIANTGGVSAPVTRAKYDPNATFTQGPSRSSNHMLSCMGQLDPPLTVRLR